MSLRTIVILLMVFLGSLILVNCSPAGFQANKESNVVPTGPTGSICDPFSEGDPAPNSGLYGNIYYLQDNQPRYGNVNQVISNGQLISTQIYLSNLYVPTRAWESGFKTQEGTLLKKENGDMLVEYFALQLQSTLKLKNGDSTGNYQLAFLADDGAVLQIKNGNNYETLMGYEGITPSRFICATSPVNFNSDTKLPIKVNWFQGPRKHIALTLLWRKWPSNNNPSDPLCGQSGNDLFFDSTQTPSQPRSAWNDLHNRGWSVLDTANYELPPGTLNPCVK